MNGGEWTIGQALEALASRRCSSEELVTGLLADIERGEKRICAYLSVDAAEALSQARAADRCRAAGGNGRLLGIPLAIKDLIHVRGQACGCASRMLEGYTAHYDATVIARLRAEGALFVGRTNMDEFAMGSTNENSAYRITCNPWDTARVPGGSSGGSAAAVAAGEALAALGTDTGGSIRLPAGFCGCVGFRPSYGRVSRYGLTAFASSLDQAGPLTKTVADTAHLLKIMAGVDPLDSTSVPAPVPDYDDCLTSRLDGMTVGLPREYLLEGIDPEVAAAVEKAVAVCERLGARVIDVSLPHTAHAIAVYYILATAEASSNLARFDGIRYGVRADDVGDVADLYARTRQAGFGSEVKRRIILGTYVLSSGYYDAYYRRAQQVQALIRNDFETVFERCQALLTPVAPSTAYHVGEKTGDPLQMYLTDVFAVPASLAGACALSLPCGMSSEGMPVGLQIIGPAFKEEQVLRVGHAYEQATQWHTMRPPQETAS